MNRRILKYTSVSGKQFLPAGLPIFRDKFTRKTASSVISRLDLRGDFCSGARYFCAACSRLISLRHINPVQAADNRCWLRSGNGDGGDFLLLLPAAKVFAAA